MKKSIFVLQKHTLLMDHQPFHWDIRIRANSHLEEMNVYDDPETLQPGAMTQVRVKRCNDLRWLTFQGRIKVGDIWTEVELLDRGEVSIVSSSDTDFTFHFYGETFKGTWTLKKRGGAWLLSKEE